MNWHIKYQLSIWINACHGHQTSCNTESVNLHSESSTWKALESHPHRPQLIAIVNLKSLSVVLKCVYQESFIPNLLKFHLKCKGHVYYIKFPNRKEKG